MATDDGKRDWYDVNLTALLIVFAASVAIFLLLALLLFVCLRLQFAASREDATRGSIDSLELTLVKSHTRTTRLLSLAGILLQLALVKLLNCNDGGDSERAPFLFSLVRPIMNVCVYFMGFMTNTHGAFRVLFLLLLCVVVVCDTVAEVQVAMMINCSASQGLKCGSSGHLFTDAATLQALQTRDLFSLFLNPWLLLEVGYLCVAVGVCGSQFSSRQLSLSRPRFNVRAGLALHFPDQFVRPPRRAGAATLAAKSASRHRTSPWRGRVHAVELHHA